MSATSGRDGSFGERLRRLREAAGLTQEELAERAGLSLVAIGALEHGQRQRPYSHTVSALADALRLSEQERSELAAAVPRRRTVRTAVGPSLPAPPTRIIGRGRELEELRDLLLGQARIVTLTGPGGVGKSRLALEVAREAADEFPDGVAFVPIAPLRDTQLVLPAIGHALGIAQAAGRPVLEALNDHLQEKRLLLVLDNFEHLLGAAPEVARLIESCPGLVVLATSRAPLRVRGEREYPVGALSLPGLDRVLRAGDVVNSPAVELFVERTRSVAPDFALTDANATAVAAVCRRLDGLPLALELAAARARVLDPTAMLARLDHALPLLTHGARDVPERQRTMEATIRWSHDLLGSGEQDLLQRLSVFAGGWDLPAAESVCAGEGMIAEDVLESISALVEQSLVLVEREREGVARFRMLEPVRQFAAELLELSGAAEDTRRRHAEYYVTLAEEARPELRGPRQQEWLQRLDAENDNLRAAMTWVLSAGDYAIAARSGWAVWLYWWLRGQLPEGRRWMEAVIARSDQLPHTLRARALMVTETIAYGQGDIASIEKYADELLELAGRTGDQHAEGFARYGRSLVAMSRREWEDAAAHLTEAAPLLHRSGDFGMASSANTFLGRLLLLRGDVPAGTRRLEQGLAMAREAGDSLGMSIALFNLAQAAQAAGDHAGAASHLRAGVVLSAEMQHRANLAYFLEGLAGVLHAQGRSDRSARLLGAAEGLLETMTGPTYNYYPPDRSGRLPLITELRERVGAEGFAAASEEGQEMTIEQAVEYALADAQGAG